MIGRNTPLDVPPPGAELSTVIVTTPAVAMSDALMVAVSLELLTKVVLRALPFHWTVELAIKLPPVKVSMKPRYPRRLCWG